MLMLGSFHSSGMQKKKNKPTKQNSFTSFTGHLIGYILLGSFFQNSLEEILV